jgi:hypothetical protein
VAAPEESGFTPGHPLKTSKHLKTFYCCNENQKEESGISAPDLAD